MPVSYPSDGPNDTGRVRPYFLPINIRVNVRSKHALNVCEPLLLLLAHLRYSSIGEHS